MRKLPFWFITKTRPAFYDVDSATAIEQTAKVYGAMQEMIEDYNKFVDEITKAFNDFTDSTDKDIECFKTHINCICENYITTIDAKVQTQDATIEAFKNEIMQSISRIEQDLNDIVDDKIPELRQDLEAENTVLKERVYELERGYIKQGIGYVVDFDHQDGFIYINGDFGNGAIPDGSDIYIDDAPNFIKIPVITAEYDGTIDQTAIYFSKDDIPKFDVTGRSVYLDKPVSSGGSDRKMYLHELAFLSAAGINFGVQLRVVMESSEPITAGNIRDIVNNRLFNKVHYVCDLSGNNVVSQMSEDNKMYYVTSYGTIELVGLPPFETIQDTITEL